MDERDNEKLEVIIVPVWSAEAPSCLSLLPIGERRARTFTSHQSPVCQRPPALPYGLPAAGFLAPLESNPTRLRE